MANKENTKIEIPDHLMKAPADQFAQSSGKTRSPSASKSRSKSKGRKLSKMEMAAKEAERKKIINAE